MGGQKIKKCKSQQMGAFFAVSNILLTYHIFKLNEHNTTTLRLGMRAQYDSPMCEALQQGLDRRHLVAAALIVTLWAGLHRRRVGVRVLIPDSPVSVGSLAADLGGQPSGGVRSRQPAVSNAGRLNTRGAAVAIWIAIVGDDPGFVC